MTNTNENSMLKLHLSWKSDLSLIEEWENFENKIKNKNLEQFSLSLIIDLEDGLESEDYPYLKDKFNQFFSSKGRHCQEINIKIISEEDELFNIVFFQFKHLSQLKKLNLYIENEDETDSCFHLLSSSLQELPSPEQLTVLIIILPNMLIRGAPLHWIRAGNTTPISQEAFLNFLKSCLALKKIKLHLISMSDSFEDGLNDILKNLPKLNTVALNYDGTGRPMSPINAVLQNSNVEEFYYFTSGESDIEPDVYDDQLRALQNTLRMNKRLKTLSLNLSGAFSNDEGLGFFDNNKEAFLTAEFFVVLKQIVMMHRLKKLELKLPSILEEFILNDINQRNALMSLFGYYINSTTKVDICFAHPELNLELHKELQTACTSINNKASDLIRSMSGPEYFQLSLPQKELNHNPILSMIVKDLSHIELLRLDIRFFYYIYQQIVMSPNDEASTMTINFIRAITEQFINKIKVLKNDYLQEQVNLDLQALSIEDHKKFVNFSWIPSHEKIMEYLDIKDIFRLILTVGGIHRYLQDQSTYANILALNQSYIFAPKKIDNIFKKSKLMQSDMTANEEHLYTSEDIDLILRARFMSRYDVGVMAPLHFGDYNFKDLFNEALEKNQQDILLFPININEHWVGISLHRTSSPIKIYFYDSLISSERAQLIQDELLSYFEDSSVEYIQMEVPYIQTDGTSCGAYLIENMFRNLHNLPRQEDISSENIRISHIELLNRFNPTYYFTQIPQSAKRKRISEISEDTITPGNRMS